MKKDHWITDARRRKLLLVLPLLVIPFFTMAFWALGGGKNDKADGQKQTESLNFQLPNAQLKDEKGENKLSYYEQAEKDSTKWREGMEKDPFFPTSIRDSLPGHSFSYDPYPFHATDYKDPNEQRVYQKLAELNHQLQSPVLAGKNPQDQILPSSVPANSSMNPGDNRLEAMMKSGGTSSAIDPEVEQLNGVMDKIIAIQHPEKLKEKSGAPDLKNKEQVYAVTSSTDGYSVSLLDTNKTDDPSNTFYTIDNNDNGKEQNSIKAVIHETQNLVDGAIVKMRLLEDIQVHGTMIAKGGFVFGKASLQGERLLIEINSIRQANSIFTVHLKAYDEDGLEGIYIPGVISRDVARQSAENALQSIELTSPDPSLKAQAASVGMNATKNLFSKKTKMVRITIKAGYKILLKSF